MQIILYMSFVPLFIKKKKKKNVIEKCGGYKESASYMVKNKKCCKQKKSKRDSTHIERVVRDLFLDRTLDPLYTRASPRFRAEPRSHCIN